MEAKVRDSPGPVSATCTGSFEIPVPAERAGALFTAEGERDWVEGWEPHFPDPGADRTAPGTVFFTGHRGSQVTWVITGARPDGWRYARFDSNGIVAAIDVDWEPVSDAATRVTVTYRSTALQDDARARLGAFEAGYDEFLASWREAIVASLGE